MALFVLKEETTSKQKLYTDGVNYTKNIIHVTCHCPDRLLDNVILVQHIFAVTISNC